MEYDVTNNFFYNDIQNIFLDHCLTIKEIDQYKDLIFSKNNLKQVYFSGNVDIRSIEIIKNLLIISDYTNDSEIEKLVLVDFSRNKLNEFLNMSFSNPFTWKIPIENNINNVLLTELPNYRKIHSFIEGLRDENLSPIEQIAKIYDKIKLMNYEILSNNNSLYDIIESKKSNSYGLNKLFTYVLEYLGYKTFIGRIKESNISYISLVEVNDKKYGVDGIYIFDPSMDSLSKDDYKDEEIRRTNYNFFGRSLKDISLLSYITKLMGVLELLAAKDYVYSENKITSTKNYELKVETKKILETFNLSFKKLYQKINKNKSISIDMIIDINNVLYKKEKEDKILRDKFISENYKERNKELFNPTINEIIEEFT